MDPEGTGTPDDTYRQVVTSAGGPDGSAALGMNNQYVFTTGTRQYGFEYETDVDVAEAIADTITTFNV